MASEMTITLNVTSSEAPSTEKQKLQETVDPSKKKGGDTGNKEKDNANDMIKGLNAKFAYRFVTSKATQIMSARISSVGVRYGDQALQNRLNNISSSVTKAVSTAGGMVITASTGNYLALAVQAVSVAMSEALSVMDRINNFKLGEMQEEREISRQSERLGLVLSKGGR